MGESSEMSERRRRLQERLTWSPGDIRVTPPNRSRPPAPSDQVTPQSHRARVADFWDEVLRRWADDKDHLVAPLDRWVQSYQGTGAGLVDFSCYPDPYVGDLRGVDREPRIVVLGLNPGVGYPGLQGPNGTWTNRIRNESYSRCFQRSPAEDPVLWRALHGGDSAYWRQLIQFSRRWLQDAETNVRDILGLELFPWHSAAVTAPMHPPPELIEEYIWAPVGEIEVPVIFALGAPWFRNIEKLGLPQVALFGKGGEPFAGPVNPKAHWRVGVYELPSGQYIVVNAQSGSGQPPGADRTSILRATLGPLLGWPHPESEVSASDSPGSI